MPRRVRKKNSPIWGQENVRLVWIKPIEKFITFKLCANTAWAALAIIEIDPINWMCMHTLYSWLSFWLWFWFQFSSLYQNHSFPFFWPTLFRLNNSPVWFVVFVAVAVAFVCLFFFLLSFHFRLTINIHFEWKNRQWNAIATKLRIRIFCATAHTHTHEHSVCIRFVAFPIEFITSVQYFDRSACFSEI